MAAGTSCATHWYTCVMSMPRTISAWPEECITREQAIESLTINIARQMLIDNERGSVSTGKYADFLLVNKDVLTCPVTEIHEAKPEATYFEGKKVFAQTHEDKSREFE